jgi:hypothetical protein
MMRTCGSLVPESDGAYGPALRLDLAQVILLRLPECLSGRDLRDDRLAQLLLMLAAPLRGFIPRSG